MTRTKGKHLSDHQWPQFACNQLSHTKPLLSWPWQMPKSSMTHERSLTIMDISHTNCARTIQKRVVISRNLLWFPRMFPWHLASWRVDVTAPGLSLMDFWWNGSLRASAANSLLPWEACRPSAANKPCRELRSRTWRHRGVTVASPCRHRVALQPLHLKLT